MSAVIMIEIVLGLVVLAGAVMFAVRDTRARSAATGHDYAEPARAAEAPERTAEAPEHSNKVPEHAAETLEHGSEQEAEQPVGEVAARV